MTFLLLLNILFRLDSVILERDSYISQRTSRIEATVAQYHLVSEEQQSAVALQLCDLYFGVDNDSAIVWAKRSFDLAERYHASRLQQRAVIAFSRCLDISGEYAMAYQLLNPYENVIHPDIASDYYKTLYRTACWQAEFSTLPDIRKKAEQDKGVLLHKVILSEPDSLWRTYYESLLTVDSRPDSAILLLRPLVARVSPVSDYYRHFCYTLGQTYEQRSLSDPDPLWLDSAVFFFAESAIANIRAGEREHTSLSELAMILYRAGDIERAYDYMNCCIEDARNAKAHLFAVRMAGNMPQILVTYEQFIRQQERGRLRLIIWLSVGAFVLLVLLIALSLFFVRYDRANRQLTLLNDQLQAVNDALLRSNQQLLESNRIRDTYVTRYMNDCSSNIEAMDRYRKNLLHILLNEQPKKLFATVKSTEAVDDMLRTFYQHFDEAFLSIFPDFISSFNSLLRPEEAFPVSDNMHLTTELRIYALIRLGITDSEQIARFLRLSVKTVQNNRSMVRNRALGDRNLLEDRVSRIPH